MIPVIIISQDRSPRVLAPLTAALGGRCRVTLDTPGELIAGGGDYLVSVRSYMPRLCSGAVVVLCSWKGAGLILPGGVHAAALSCDRRARRVLQRSRCEALCCGMSSCDPLTLSSLREDSAVISLQRELVDLRGETIEPCDIPVKLSDRLDPDTLLLAAAAALLCGETPLIL